MALTENRAAAVPDAQRRRILKISADLFAEKGYQAVGVAEIGERVGLGRGALYYHIGSKEELLYDIIIDYISELVATGNVILRDTTDPRDRIDRLSRHIMQVVSANMSELSVCFRQSDCLTGTRYDSVARLHSEYEGIWRKACEDGARRGVFRRIPQVALKGLLGMYFHAFLWLDPKGKCSAVEIADIFTDIVLRALAPAASVKTARR